MGRLVNTRTGQLAGPLVVEAKGQTQPVTERGAARLDEQIGRTLISLYVDTAIPLPTER
jgi:hypothetical protein